MNKLGINSQWLLTESLRVGTILLLGFLLAHFLDEFIAAFGIELLYGLRSTLITVIQNTALLTGLLYVITKGINTSSSSANHRGD
ncbi:hypothetical protein [Haladaptatus caseinilyticus]|uniref:hypothetical protein n=1 Tax=Haladaptatus caseinilyticus TaxID=2993314 RepID=UPI00224AF12E|nr:hypothetical protein [Haladaptatus caseinilyticus]